MSEVAHLVGMFRTTVYAVERVVYSACSGRLWGSKLRFIICSDILGPPGILYFCINTFDFHTRRFETGLLKKKFGLV